MRGLFDETGRHWTLVAAIFAGVTVAATREAKAQLISPGRLSAAHQELEGMRQCTQCHQLRTRGITNTKCLACHQPLQARISAGRGLHGRIADRNCADCHKDHFGRDFAVVRFDTTQVDHDTLGYRLEESHAALNCSDCHAAERISAPEVLQFKGEHGALDRTYLGLGTTCASCHVPDDPHQGQFPNARCDDCHTSRRWDPAALFDHARSRYPLTGRHDRVACGACHSATRGPDGAVHVVYRPLAHANCRSCHDDVHRGTMGGTCETCHSTSGWGGVNQSQFENRFDHSATSFDLVGRHADVACGGCHDIGRAAGPELHIVFSAGSAGRTYPAPLAANCASCHVDYHGDVFATTPGGVTCDNCHGQRTWYPSTYGLERHNRETIYALRGAHVAVLCTDCHTELVAGQLALRFRFSSTRCAACHLVDDPHQGQFGDDGCETCHTQAAFTIDGFDHDRTAYPLDATHRPVPCPACHTSQTSRAGVTFTRYTPLGRACRDCHGGAP